ncbi:hypothetical protein CC80DRAFT_501460 [Byssothecium circinans]|uniref:Uncharacterized protein n=1 Tax=Byssothecium circinans TaxID=147558 RepID=A0A6A5U688_9PLEO|nr:hypothetical protein CC80DRAFT_501460 [Byssothecium circinans]
MARKIYLAILHNDPPTPAHWAIFIPTTGHDLKGKLAQVDDRYIHDTVGNGAATEDTTAHDRLEMAALDVPPPKKSEDCFSPTAPNCQTWLEEYVEELIRKGYVTDAALEIVRAAPKRI